MSKEGHGLGFQPADVGEDILAPTSWSFAEHFYIYEMVHRMHAADEGLELDLEALDPLS